MTKLSENKAFSDLEGLTELTKETSNQSSFFNFFGRTNKTVYKVYQVQGDSYGIGFHKREGEVIEIGGKIFPNGKGCFCGEDGKWIQKEMKSFEVGDDFYTGECKNGKREGWGIYIFANGDSYTGEWGKGKREGRGKDIVKNRNSYQGEWLPCEIEQYEVDIYKKSYYYKSGESKTNGERRNPGKVTFERGYSYDGEWTYDMQDGQGTLTSTKGYSYTGQWCYGKKKGLGKFTSKNGDSYTGEWGNGKKNGFGVVNFANGDSYEGIFKDDKLEVMLKFTYVNGNVYKGGWEDGKPHGQGTFTATNGDSYEGIFTNGITMDFSKIIITNSNNESHTIIKEGQSYFYQLGEEGEKINIDNEKTLKSALLQFGNKYLNQEIIAIKNLQELLINGKIKNPQELREFINEKLKELNNGPKENKSLPGQELMINSCHSLSSQRVACQQ